MIEGRDRVEDDAHTGSEELPQRGCPPARGGVKCTESDRVFCSARQSTAAAPLRCCGFYYCSIYIFLNQLLFPGQNHCFLCGSFALKMAGDGGALKDINEIKSQFRTREGFYKLLTLSDSQQRGGLPRGPSAGATLGPGAGAGPIPGGGVGLLQGPAAAAAAAAAAASSSSNAATNSSPAGFLPPVRVSMVKLQPEDPSEESERVCFNIGRELYFYTYTNIKKVSPWLRCSVSLAC